MKVCETDEKAKPLILKRPDLLECLAPREKEILRLRFGMTEEGREYSYHKIALRLDLSSTRVDGIKNRALVKILLKIIEANENQ